MDAATAAAMSDPALNRHFRRRWADGGMPAPPKSSTAAPPPAKALEQLGRALLRDWRAARIKEGAQ